MSTLFDFGSPKRNRKGSPISTPTRGNDLSTRSPGSSSSPSIRAQYTASSPKTNLNRTSSDTIYSDRFIPSRLSSKLSDAFDVMEQVDPNNNRGNNGINGINNNINTNNNGNMSSSSSNTNDINNNNHTEYSGSLNNLIRSELLGSSYLDMNASVVRTINVDGSGINGNMSSSSMPMSMRSPNRTQTANVLKYKSNVGGRRIDSPLNGNSLLYGGGSSSLLSSSSGGLPLGSGLGSPPKPLRKIPRVPFKVLDAPNLQDDFYLNLVDWSSSNLLAVGLGSCVYLWSACTSKVTKMHDLGSNDSVTSVCWAGGDHCSSSSGGGGGTGNTKSHLAVGTNSGKVLIWDAVKCKHVTTLASHSARVGTLAWNSSLVASGSRDRNIFLQDPRMRSADTSNSSSSSSSTDNNSNADLFGDDVEGAVRRFVEETTFGRDRDGSISSSSRSRSGSRNRTRSSSRTDDGEGMEVDDNNNDNDDDDDDDDDDDESNGGVTANNTDADVDRDDLDPDQEAASSSSSSSARSDSRSRRAMLGSGIGGTGDESHSGHANRQNIRNSCLVRTLVSHKQEVCGLKWSFDGKYLASGGNDNKLLVWDSVGGNSNQPICRFSDHTAAVKAVAWSPHQHGLFASGGGTADRHIRFWNALNGTALHRIDTGSQVCNLMWSTSVNEIVSTHGYSLNQIIIWKYPTMQKLATLTGHTYRVLYLAMSPDGQTIVTGAGDETLRFWGVFPGPRGRGSGFGSTSLLPTGNIR